MDKLSIEDINMFLSLARKSGNVDVDGEGCIVNSDIISQQLIDTMRENERLRKSLTKMIERSEKGQDYWYGEYYCGLDDDKIYLAGWEKDNAEAIDIIHSNKDS